MIVNKMNSLQQIVVKMYKLIAGTLNASFHSLMKDLFQVRGR